MAVDTKAPNDTVADALRRRAAAIDKHDPHTAALLRMGADTICNLVATRNELNGEIARAYPPGAPRNDRTEDR